MVRFYVLWLTVQHMPVEFFRQVGYCTQFDSCPPGTHRLRLHLWPRRLHLLARRPQTTSEALERAGMRKSPNRKVAATATAKACVRIRLLQVIAHILLGLFSTEPLNASIPCRAESIALSNPSPSRMHVNQLQPATFCKRSSRSPTAVVLSEQRPMLLPKAALKRFRREVPASMQILCAVRMPASWSRRRSNSIMFVEA